MVDLARELRVMHACEKGAVGVYRGHKCVARYFFRSRLPELDTMRFHERAHSNIFAKLLADRGFRQCFFADAWFLGGLFYGVFVGLWGIKAIGESTVTIEDIVDKEFEISLAKIQQWPDLCDRVKLIQLEEREHKARGEIFSQGASNNRSIWKKIATAAAYAAKYFAERL